MLGSERRVPVEAAVAGAAAPSSAGTAAFPGKGARLAEKASRSGFLAFGNHLLAHRHV